MPSKSLASRLLAEWPVKALSLGAAVVLFFFYQYSRLEDRYISVPLTVTANDDYVLASQAPRSVRVTLRGEANAIVAIQEEDIRASLDLSSYRAEGQFRAPVLVERRGAALGVDPLEIRTDPADVAVTIGKRVSRTVPVTPSFKGFLEPGYEIVSFDLTPSEVDISGPESAVSQVDDMQTDFIELTGRNSDFTVKTRLVNKESLVSVSGPGSVEFRAVVQRSLAIKTFEGVAIQAEGLASELVLSQSLPLASLRLRSSTADIAGYSPPLGTLYVDLSAIRGPGAYQVKVQARAPDGFTVERFDPQSVQATVALGTGSVR
jgi:YbbR domain-containing protein